jgi:tetratricopeptide (TPR) repeat protein
MSLLRLLAVLAVIAISFVTLAYGAAYVVASSRAGAAVEQSGTFQPGGGATQVGASGVPSSDAQIAFWSRRVAGNPSAYLDMTILGRAFARKARETSDVGDYLRAQAALRRALHVSPDYVEAKASLSSVLFSLHEFRKALALARPIVDDPRGLQALATLGDANLALGNYSRARAAYKRLLAFAESPGALSRLAVLSDVEGDPDQALTLMRRAAELAEESGDSGESLAWFTYQIGELSFRAGRVDAAAANYRSALRLFHDYPLALAGLAKAEAAQGDFPAAIGLYRRATEIVPQPDYLAALGDVYAATGHRRMAREEYATVEVVARLAKANRQVYNRQLANFLSDHDLRVRDALRLARAELRVRKDIYGYDAAGWASYKNGLLDDAQRFMQRALSLGTRDPRLLYHAGMVARAQGRTDVAWRLLSGALRLNPRFDPLQARIARKALDGVAVPVGSA